MDSILDNVNNLRDMVQRRNFDDTTVIDVFTAFYVLSTKRIDYSIMDDKYFQFLLGVINNVPSDKRHHWFKSMFSIYERLSGIASDDSNWLLLQANLIYLSPISRIV